MTPRLLNLSSTLKILSFTLLVTSCNENIEVIPVSSEKNEKIDNSYVIEESDLLTFLDIATNKSNSRNGYSVLFKDFENYLETALNFTYGDMRLLSKKSKMLKGSINFDYKNSFDEKDIYRIYQKTLNKLKSHKRDVDFKVDFVNFIDIDIEKNNDHFLLNYAIKFGEKESNLRIPPRWVFSVTELKWNLTENCNGVDVSGLEFFTYDEIEKRATYNVNRTWDFGPCCYYTVNIESAEFASDQSDSYGFGNMWDLSCTYQDLDCSCWETLPDCDCSEFYNPWLPSGIGLTYNSNGVAHTCLETQELNDELNILETAGENWANSKNKVIIGFDLDDSSLCGGSDHGYIILPKCANRGYLLSSPEAF